MHVRSLGSLSSTPVRAARRLVSRLARRAGYYVTRDPVAALHREQLRRLIASREIDCVLDVGAYFGDFGVLVRELGYRGPIVSFEPVAENFARLQARAAGDARWETRQLALGTVRGDAEITLFEGSTFHSFLAPSALGRERFPDKMTVARSEVVGLERLEHVVGELVAERGDLSVLLKVDAQGYDLDVVRGLGAELPRVRVLQLELSVQPIYERVTNPYLGALAELEALGFQLSGIFPVNYGRDGLSLVELDCLMLGPGPVAVPPGSERLLSSVPRTVAH